MVICTGYTESVVLLCVCVVGGEGVSTCDVVCCAAVVVQGLNGDC